MKVEATFESSDSGLAWYSSPNCLTVAGSATAKSTSREATRRIDGENSVIEPYRIAGTIAT
jgi:hypothetical protein